MACDRPARLRRPPGRPRPLDLRQASLGGVANPAIGKVHRAIGAGALLLSIPLAYHCAFAYGVQTFDTRIAVHSLAGCFFYGAFAAKLTIVRSPRLPGWVLPLAGGTLVVLIAVLWYTSALWYFNGFTLPSLSRRGRASGRGQLVPNPAGTRTAERSRPPACGPRWGPSSRYLRWVLCVLVTGTAADRRWQELRGRWILRPMAREDAETCKRAVEAYNHGDVEGFVDQFDPAVEWHPLNQLMFGGEAEVYRGHEGVRRFMNEVAEAFAGVQIEVLDIRDLGERIVMTGQLRALGRASGARTESPIGWLLEFSNAGIVRMRDFLDPIKPSERPESPSSDAGGRAPAPPVPPRPDRRAGDRALGTDVRDPGSDPHRESPSSGGLAAGRALPRGVPRRGGAAGQPPRRAPRAPGRRAPRRSPRPASPRAAAAPR